MAARVVSWWRARPSLIAYACVAVVALGFYTWTAKTSSDLAPIGQQNDPYNLLADSFLHGHTYLPIRPDPRTPDLEDRWNPRVKRFVTETTLDLSYYRGRLYAYWGPAPVVLFFVPWRALPLGELPIGLAVLGLAFAVLLLELCLLERLTSRFLPRTPVWMRATAAALLAFGNVAPYLLRRPAVYEVTHLTGVAAALLGLLLLLEAVRRRPPRHLLLAAAGACFGLAVLSRLPAFGVLVAVPAALLGLRRAGALADRAATARAAAALLAPLVVCGLAYAAYNAARFGSPLEFGQRFQINLYDPTTNASPAFVPGGLWYYLIAPVRVVAEFPFVWLNAVPNTPFSMPADYVGVEPVAGVLATTPLLWLLVGARPALRGRPAVLQATVAVLVGYAAVVVAFASFYIAGATQRYEADFAAPLLIAACLVWFALAERATGRGRRRLLAAFGVAAVAWSCLVGVSVSFIGLRNLLRVRQPATYEALRRDTEPVATLMAKLAGHPILAAVDRYATVGPRRYDRLGVAGADLALPAGRDALPLQIVAPDARSASVTGRLATRAAGPLVLTVRSGAGPSRRVRVGRGEVTLPVRLERGLNDVTIRLERGGGPAARLEGLGVR